MPRRDLHIPISNSYAIKRVNNPVTRLFGLVMMMLSGLLFTLAVASEDDELGPEIGTIIPHDLAVGEQASFEEMTGDNGAVLVFVRSVSWCPFCKRQIIELDMAQEAFRALGVNLIYVSYDTAAKQQKFAEQKQLGGKFVSDPQSQIIDAFGIRNENHQPGSFGYGIPHPIIFVLDSDGMILRKIYEEDFARNAKSYASRPEAEIVLASAREVFGNPAIEEVIERPE